MLSAEDAIRIIRQLESNTILVWLVGGWGVDALLGEQTRPHKDLDILVQLDDVLRLRQLLADDGYSLKELWEENRQACDSRGNQIATAFVLQDAAGREIDIHALVLDGQGNAIPAWEDTEGRIFKLADLSVPGQICGEAVKCMSAGLQLQCHTGYTLPEYQVRDLARLQEKIGGYR